MKKNVCFHIDNISKCGGTEKVTLEIASLLCEKYSNIYNIYILSNYSPNEIFFSFDSGINFINLFNKKTRMLTSYFTYISKIKNIIKKFDFDLIISVDTFLSLVDLPSCMMCNIKQISWEHFSFNYKSNSKLLKLSRYISSKKSNIIITLTDNTKNEYIKKFRCKNVIRIFNPIYTNDCTKNLIHENILLSVGRLTNEKGFDLALQVAKSLKLRNVRYKWIIVGDGNEYNNLMKYVNSNNLNENVEFVGRKENVGNYYKNARLFVLPSRSEAFGVVILEAFSYGVPVISFNCGAGPCEIIEDGINGYLIENYDIEKMADKIQQLLCDNAKYIYFSNNTNKCLKNYDANLIIKQWNNLLLKVLGDENIEKN